MVESQNIPVDRALRTFIGNLAAAVGSHGVAALQNDTELMKAPGLLARWTEGDALVFERSFAGFNWRFILSVDELAAVASSEMGEIPMVRNAPGTEGEDVSGSDDSAYLADSLLAAVGFGAGPSSDRASLLDPPSSEQDGSKVDFLPEGADELPDSDESDVTKEEVDDLLNHPEVQKLLDLMGIEAGGAETGLEVDGEPELEDRTEVDLRVPDMEEDLDENLDENLDEDDDAEESDEADAEVDGLQQAAQFLVLLVDAEKLELADDVDLTPLAYRLIPILADEDAGDSERSARLIDWLLDQAEVEDVFLSDDEMTRILKAW